VKFLQSAMRFIARSVFLVAVVVAGSRAIDGTGSATLSVASGGDLQFALNAAQPGDVVEIPAGARFIGQYNFPCKSGMVTLRSASVLSDSRITPASAPLLATIASPYAMYAVNLQKACNWTLDGIRFEPNVAGAGEVIALQDSNRIILRRLLFVVPPDKQQKRFIAGNGTDVTLTQSHCQGVWISGQDSQCFAAWDGAGPYRITDNFLEAASENVMFGGADSTAPERVPANILVENNTFTKDLAWKGQPRNVKNLFELKSAKHVVIRKNTFEHNWIDGQSGRAILFTPRNQDGQAVWSGIEDVLFELNIVRDTPTCMAILGYDDIFPSRQTTSVVIRDNEFACNDVGLLMMAELGRVEVYRNKITVPADRAYLMLTSTESLIATGTGTRQAKYAAAALTWAENVTPNGYIHSPTALNEAALQAYTLAYTLTLGTEPLPVPDPEPMPIPDPIVKTDADRIREAIALLEPLDASLSGKARTNLRNILTRLRSLLELVK
jgi:hypothetical protein